MTKKPFHSLKTERLIRHAHNFNFSEEINIFVEKYLLFHRVRGIIQNINFD